MLALIALMTVAIGTVLLLLVSITAMLSIMRLQRDTGFRRISAASSPDLSLAISHLVTAVPAAGTVRRPHSHDPVPAAQVTLHLPVRPTLADKVVYQFNAAPNSDDHSIQPLIDYVRAELAQRATG